MKEAVEQNKAIGPSEWVRAAAKLNVLRGDEDNLLWDLHQKIAVQKVKLISEGSTVASAKAQVDATDDYRDFKKQQAKIEMVVEFIRIAKVHILIVLFNCEPFSFK